MKPTTKLRFVTRDAYRYENPDKTVTTVKTHKVLQQWWEESATINLGWTGEMPIGQSKGEWRDVPLEDA